jgi:hypothetical protein
MPARDCSFPDTEELRMKIAQKSFLAAVVALSLAMSMTACADRFHDHHHDDGHGRFELR